MRRFVPSPNDIKMPVAAQDNSRAVAFVALVLGALAMGISPTFVRLAEVGPFAGAFWRVFLALPFLYVWAMIEERGKPQGSVPRFPKATILAGVMFTGDLFFWHLAIFNTSVANATFFATTAPLFVAGAGFFVFGRKLSSAEGLGIVLCIAGGGVLIWESLGGSSHRVAGDLYGVATAFFFGIYFLAVERARQLQGAGRLIFESSLITAGFLLVVALIAGDDFLPETTTGYAALLGLGVISHFGGQGLLAVALGRLPALFSSLVIFLEAIAAALFAWLVLEEQLSVMQGLGGLVILIGIAVARPKA
jgi:drug/metabolite transporter (DMT)-like permease